MKIENISTSKKIYPYLKFKNKNPFCDFSENKNINQTKQFLNLKKYSESKNSYSETVKKKIELKLPIVVMGAALLTIAGLSIYKFSNIEKIINKDNSDKIFKKNIVKALKKEGINCNIKSLKSITAPGEFRELVSKFKPEHYQAGMQTGKKLTLDEFYKNSIDGNFRVSLHTHSNFSDGKATVEEFLDCAEKYAKKVKKMNKNDNLPPFTIALTDHDNLDGVKEAYRIIAKNPEKYKDIKFVSGVEFSTKSFMGNHDITALCVNPFDENLNKIISNLKTQRTKTINNFLQAQDDFQGRKITLEDLVKYENNKNKLTGKPSKRTIENRAGVVYVRHAIKYYCEITGKQVNNEILNKLGTKDNISMEEIVKAVKNSGGYCSLTHPLKSFWKYIGDDNLLKFKQMGIEGIEANHQYTPSKINEIKIKSGLSGNADDVYQYLTKKYSDFANKNSMFISGGTDCHEKQIFSREPKITDDFLRNKILK